MVFFFYMPKIDMKLWLLSTVLVHGAASTDNLKWLKTGMCMGFVFYGERNPQMFSTSLNRWNWFCLLKDD